VLVLRLQQDASSTYHVATRASSGEEHVGGNLSQNVTNKENRNTSLVLWNLVSEHLNPNSSVTYQFLEG
jgi:hypothetical protein